MKNFLDKTKTMKFVYPKYNHLQRLAEMVLDGENMRREEVRKKDRLLVKKIEHYYGAYYKAHNKRMACLCSPQ